MQKLTYESHTDKLCDNNGKINLHNREILQLHLDEQDQKYFSHIIHSLHTTLNVGILKTEGSSDKNNLHEFQQ